MTIRLKNNPLPTTQLSLSNDAIVLDSSVLDFPSPAINTSLLIPPPPVPATTAGGAIVGLGFVVSNSTVSDPAITATSHASRAAGEQHNKAAEEEQDEGGEAGPHARIVVRVDTGDVVGVVADDL